MDSEPAAERLREEYRQEFRLYAYSARVDHDPADDFDGFIEDLWIMVASRFRLVPEAGEAWVGVGDAELARSDDAPDLATGEELFASDPSPVEPADAAGLMGESLGAAEDPAE